MCSSVASRMSLLSKGVSMSGKKSVVISLITVCVDAQV